jgi:hypothetical protein
MASVLAAGLEQAVLDIQDFGKIAAVEQNYYILPAKGA